MPRGVVLTEKERGEILGMWRCGKSKSFIAKVLERSRGVVTSFLKNTEGYGTIMRRPKPKKMSRRTMMQVLRQASLGNDTSSSLKKSST